MHALSGIAAGGSAGDEARPRAGADGESWSPERHRVITGEEVVELLPALAGREPTGGYLFYDCQTDDVRLVLTVLGEAERFGAVCANRLEVSALLEQDGLARGRAARDVESGRDFQVRAANVVNATGVWADELRPQELHDEAELPRSVRAAAPTSRSARGLPLVGGAIVPAGQGARSSRCRGSAAPDRHHRQRLRGGPRARLPPPRTWTTCCRP